MSGEAKPLSIVPPHVEPGAVRVEPVIECSLCQWPVLPVAQLVTCIASDGSDRIFALHEHCFALLEKFAGDMDRAEAERYPRY